MTYRGYFFNPLLNENPVTVQILGLCSALAVSRASAAKRWRERCVASALPRCTSYQQQAMAA